MIWLAAHMWFLLLTTFAIGLAVGWWVWGKSETKPALPKDETAPMGTLDSDIGTVAKEND